MGRLVTTFDAALMPEFDSLYLDGVREGSSHLGLQAPETGAAESKSALNRDPRGDEMGSVSRSSGHGFGTR